MEKMHMNNLIWMLDHILVFNKDAHTPKHNMYTDEK